MQLAFYAPMKSPAHETPSGDRRMARLLIAALETAGHDVALASEFRSFERTGDPARQAGLRALGAAEAARLIADWQSGDDRRKPAAWFTYHLYYKAPDHLGPAVAAAIGIPYLVAEASHAPKRADGPWDLGHHLAGDAIRRAKAVFCLTRHDANCVAPLVAPPHRLIQLPPFLDAAAFTAAADRAAALRADMAVRAGLDPDRRWLLAVAMMRPGDKLESYRRLGAALDGLSGDDWCLLVVGDGPASDAARAALAPLGAKVHFLGGQPPDVLPAIYAACDLYVWPAAGEAYGMALLEAQAAGLPVVAGCERGVPDVVEDGRTGLLATAGDPVDFAAKVRRLIDRPDLRRRLGEAARRFVAEERTVPAAAARLDEGLQWAVR